MKKVKKVWKWIMSNWFKWLLDLIRMLLVALLSYFILKELQKIQIIGDFWASNERFYLGGYVTIQIVVTFLFYTLIGKILEVLTYRWIIKNRREYIIETNRSDEKEVKQYIYVWARFIVGFKLLSIEDFEIFTDIEMKQSEYKNKWKNTVDIIKRLVGILLLVIANILVSPKYSDWFWWVTVVCVALGVLSFFVLIFYYLIVENLRIVQIVFKGLVISGRLERKRRFKLNNNK